MSSPVISLWPSYLYPAHTTVTSSQSPALSRLLIADIVMREHHDLPMPNVPATVRTLPFTTAILSTNPDDMRTALAAAGVHDGVTIIPMPKSVRSNYWEGLQHVLRAHDLVVVDDVSHALASARQQALLWVRVLCDRQAIWVFQQGLKRGPAPTLADDVIESAIALDENGRLVVGLAPRRGVRNPPPLLADVEDGRLNWLDPAVIWRRQRLTELAAAG